MIILKQMLEVNVGHVDGGVRYLSSFTLVSQTFCYMRSVNSLHRIRKTENVSNGRQTYVRL